MPLALKCDKPYNIDEARKRKGLPRSKREDSRTTMYELTIVSPMISRSSLTVRPSSQGVLLFSTVVSCRMRSGPSRMKRTKSSSGEG